VENNNVDTTKELPTVIAFCAGYGGIERGLELAGLEHRVIAYVEIEAYAIANLVSKMETGQLPPAPIYTDIKTFPSEIFRDRVDIITGGYPCQPFSAAGKRLGEDDPRHLWPYIRKHVETIRPVQCFFENVEGHISLGLSTVLSDQVRHWPTPDVAQAQKVSNRPNYGQLGLANHPEVHGQAVDRPKMQKDRLGRQGQVRNNTNGNSQEQFGKLNPYWVEHLMGIETGWTDLGSWETQ